MWSETADALLTELKENKAVKSLVEPLERDVMQGKTTPTIAARKLIDAFRKRS
tara:strand:- start:330 stop:488 length:159 start_codon:yes stop_codon:yes gene_type:complete